MPRHKKEKKEKRFHEKQYKDIRQRVKKASGAVGKMGEVQAASYVWANVSLSSGSSLNSGDLRGVNGLPATGVAGVFLDVRLNSWNDFAYSGVQFAPYGETPTEYSSGLRVLWADGGGSGMAMVGLSEDGKITMKNAEATISSGIYVSVIGYWQ